MTRHRRSVPLAIVLALGLAPVTGCKPKLNNATGDIAKERAARNLAKRLQAACSSKITYDRLKQIAFDEAIRIRNADPANLATLATSSLVRVEQPAVVSRDETLDVTVCRGRFILTIPPGAEAAFGGEHQLAADIEYAAQAAADGSGLVYQIKGAEPIIYKLAAFDLQHTGHATGSLPTRVARAEPVPPSPISAPTRAAPPPAPIASATWAAEVRSAPTPTAAAHAAGNPQPGQASPSFNCGYGRSQSERMVCGSPELATLDRTMASRYYAALSSGTERARAELRRSRDRFLAYRERCGSEECVAQAYRDRMDEIDDIAGR